MTKILIEEATVKLVLDALETAWYHVGTFYPTEEAIELYDDARAALKALVEQPAQQEPYGYVSTHTNGQMHFNKTFHGVYRDTATEVVAVYTAPQPAQQEFVSPGGGYVPAIPAQQRPIKTFHGGKAWPVQEPAQRKPLTDEEIEAVWKRVQADDFHDCVQPFARAIEAAHGIKENI